MDLYFSNSLVAKQVYNALVLDKLTVLLIILTSPLYYKSTNSADFPNPLSKYIIEYDFYPPTNLLFKSTQALTVLL
jgi:hypothetical protein